MNRRIAAALAFSLVAGAPSVDAQTRVLNFVRDTSYNMRVHGLQRFTNVLVGRDGRMLFTPEYWNGEVVLFDSLFKKQAFTFKIGRRTDIAYFTQIGWVGDSVWVLDPLYKQVVYVGSNGEMAKSIGFPSWVRPFWKDRRQYPLFARMTWYAAYPDGTLLTEPAQPRHLLDTPGYDPTQRMLVRIDGDGRIVKLIARMPQMDGRFQLRSGTEKKAFTVSGYAKSHWAVSSDGLRVAVVTPVASDSGAFQVTTINDNGDTLFSRRYVVEANRFNAKRRDSLVAGFPAFGRYSEEQVRDTIKKLMPEFFSPVTGVDVGVDYSVWVTIRRPTTKVDEGEWFVVDATGEPRGIVTLARNTKFVSRSLDRIWTQQVDRAKNTAFVIRYLPKDATATRPSRSVRAGASSQPETPRE
jgi:hypothetical protein